MGQRQSAQAVGKEDLEYHDETMDVDTEPTELKHSVTVKPQDIVVGLFGDVNAGKTSILKMLFHSCGIPEGNLKKIVVSNTAHANADINYYESPFGLLDCESKFFFADMPGRDGAKDPNGEKAIHEIDNDNQDLLNRLDAVILVLHRLLDIDKYTENLIELILKTKNINASRMIIVINQVDGWAQDDFDECRQNLRNKFRTIDPQLDANKIIFTIANGYKTHPQLDAEDKRKNNFGVEQLVVALQEMQQVILNDAESLKRLPFTIPTAIKVAASSAAGITAIIIPLVIAAFMKR